MVRRSTSNFSGVRRFEIQVSNLVSRFEGFEYRKVEFEIKRIRNRSSKLPIGFSKLV
jgi:hypothetical protein